MLWNERVAILGIDCNMSFYTLVGIITSILRTAAIFDTLTSTKKQVLRDPFIRASFNIF